MITTGQLLDMIDRVRKNKQREVDRTLPGNYSGWLARQRFMGYSAALDDLQAELEKEI